MHEDRHHSMVLCPSTMQEKAKPPAPIISSVARSFTEAKYSAVDNVSTEVIWLRSLLKQTEQDASLATEVRCDDIAAALNAPANVCF